MARTEVLKSADVILPDVGILLVLVGVTTSERDLSVGKSQVALDEGARSGVQVLGRAGVEGSVAGQSVTEGLKRGRDYLRIEIRSIVMALLTSYVVGGWYVSSLRSRLMWRVRWVEWLGTSLATSAADMDA